METGWQREALPSRLRAGDERHRPGGCPRPRVPRGIRSWILGAYAAAAQTTGLVVVLATATNRFYAPRLSLLLERADFASMENVRRQRMLWVVPLVAAFLVAALGFRPRSWGSSARVRRRRRAGASRPRLVDRLLRPLLDGADLPPVLAPHSARASARPGAPAGVQVFLFALVPSLGATGAAIAYAVAMVGMYAVFVTAAHRELVALRARQRRPREAAQTRRCRSRVVSV